MPLATRARRPRWVRSVIFSRSSAAEKARTFADQRAGLGLLEVERHERDRRPGRFDAVDDDGGIDLTTAAESVKVVAE